MDWTKISVRYDGEHMTLLAMVPGWKRGRRFKVEEVQGEQVEKVKQIKQTGTMANKPVFKYLAIHELDNNNFLETPEFKKALSTEWRDKIMTQYCVGREMRIFELHKDFGKPTH